MPGSDSLDLFSSHNAYELEIKYTKAPAVSASLSISDRCINSQLMINAQDLMNWPPECVTRDCDVTLNLYGICYSLKHMKNQSLYMLN